MLNPDWYPEPRPAKRESCVKHRGSAHGDEGRRTEALGTCPDCGAGVDADGWTLEENGCGWSHPDDCETCGHPYCDLSC